MIMPVFLFYHPGGGSPTANSTQRNAVLVVGSTEAEARAAAQASAPDGETKVHADWPALVLASLPHYDLTDLGGVVWIRGAVAEPLGA